MKKTGKKVKSESYSPQFIEDFNQKSDSLERIARILRKELKKVHLSSKK